MDDQLKSEYLISYAIIIRFFGIDIETVGIVFIKVIFKCMELSCVDFPVKKVKDLIHPGFSELIEIHIGKAFNAVLPEIEGILTDKHVDMRIKFKGSAKSMKGRDGSFIVLNHLSILAFDVGVLTAQ